MRVERIDGPAPARIRPRHRFGTKPRGMPVSMPMGKHPADARSLGARAGIDEGNRIVRKTVSGQEPASADRPIGATPRAGRPIDAAGGGDAPARRRRAIQRRAAAAIVSPGKRTRRWVRSTGPKPSPLGISSPCRRATAVSARTSARARIDTPIASSASAP